MRLYGVSQEEVEQVVDSGDAREVRGGTASELPVGGRTLRVIWVREGDSQVVKTVYPARQRKRG